MPIAKSKDLVNWEMAGYAVERFDEHPAYDLKEGEGAGHFSMCVANDVKGPWTRSIFPEYLYDPGLFFDDNGKVYVVHGQGTLYVTELNADALSVKDQNVKIWNQRFKNANELDGGYGMEGAHVYKIN